MCHICHMVNPTLVLIASHSDESRDCRTMPWWMYTDWSLQVRASPDEKSLIANLFEEREYNSLVRPVRRRSETIQVGFEMALIQIITLVI